MLIFNLRCPSVEINLALIYEQFIAISLWVNMCSRLLMYLLLFAIYVNLYKFGLKVHTLVYPPTTVYQMIGSISIPISGLPMNHKVFFDWGFQMNYQMPFNLSEFYMVPIWSTGASNVQKRHLHYQTDFTVRELYEGLKDLLERSCLGRSICELARRPFDDNYKNILTDILTFLLTPSLHEEHFSAANPENSIYNDVEFISSGIGHSCRFLYQNCTMDLLSLISRY
ncbi:uncharacterized protein ACN427_014541 isoform 2-T2 [Glossina fuscipes fuscipes]